MEYCQKTRVDLPLRFSKEALDDLYSHYNRRQHIHPDPLEFLYIFDDPRDREIVGLIASALAYGRVAQINRSVSQVLNRMGRSPYLFLQDNSRAFFRKHFKEFKHRFTTGEHLAALLAALRRILLRHGSLEACFLRGLKKGDKTVLDALKPFVEELSEEMGCKDRMFIPSPGRGSACKRLNLFLRWMVRCDDVDPGIWRAISPSLLIVPVDIHMHRIGLMFGLTRRKQADMKAAMEITEGFRCMAPEDPVRYDFALTRLGIHGTMPKASGREPRLL